MGLPAASSIPGWGESAGLWIKRRPMTAALYIASVVGAVALYMMMPRRGYTPVRFGFLLGACSLGGLWLFLGRELPAITGLPDAAAGYYYLFGAIAIAAAARVITQSKPVYSALWFVMVVLAVAGLFLTLEAEFMAFAMVIIYGGAILVTYVFVIMLAADSGDASDEDTPEYDRLPREPVAAIAVGFLMLSLLLSVFAMHSEDGSTFPQNYQAQSESDAFVITNELTQRPVTELEAKIKARNPDAVMPADLAKKDKLDNIEKVGLDLFKSHPLGLELAGVILLVAIIGAVVIAKKRVEDDALIQEEG
ncbi:MAG: hypothetical protein CMJ19_18745 [Phycisphaeraceae bacterium]|nr:hypothetical protein [Phycisphaeraceae bacterium]